MLIYWILSRLFICLLAAIIPWSQYSFFVGKGELKTLLLAELNKSMITFLRTDPLSVGSLTQQWDQCGTSCQASSEIGDCKQDMSNLHLSYVLNERMIAQRRILCTIIKDRGVSADWKDGRQTVAPSLISVSHQRRFRKTKGESLGEGNSYIFSLDFGSREERNALSARQSHIHIERIGFRGNEIGSLASSEKDFLFAYRFHSWMSIFYSKADQEFYAKSGLSWDLTLVNQSYEWVESAIVFRPELRTWQSYILVEIVYWRQGLIHIMALL